MSLKLSEDATKILAILFLLYSVSIHQPFLSKSLTFARILLERKMKIAVDMIIICTKRNVDSIVPPCWNFKEACRTSLVPWEIQLFAQTVTHDHVRRSDIIRDSF